MLNGNFEEDKNELIQLIDSQFKLFPSKNVLIQIKEELESINSYTQLNGWISRKVKEELLENEKIGEQLIEFEKFYRDETNFIQSKILQQIAKYLLSQRAKITYFGTTWSQRNANWIYFDIVLNIEMLQKQFQWDETIQLSENLDPKSGLERGLFDTKTEEGLMGKVR